MRVLVVDTYYPPFIAAHYEARPELAERPYDEQLAALYSRSFGTSDAYSHNLRRLGHESAEVIVNCSPLQLRWAQENRSPLARVLARARALPGRIGHAADQASLHRIAFDQIEDFGPDILYVQDLWFFSRRELDRLRSQGIKVVGQIASPPPEPAVLRSFDLITTSFPHFVGRFRELGVRSEYLKIAFDERVPDRLRERGVEVDPGGERSFDVTFVGGVHPAAHGKRIELLERVAAVADLQLWAYGVDSLPAGSPILSRYRGEAWGLDMYEVLARSRIVINRHIDAAHGYANNMRLYETTGVGTLLLTDPGRNLAELFDPGQEVAVYEDADDLVEKVSRYLAHPDERLRIAAAGQSRTLREHTYGRRIAELASILETL